MNPVIAALNAEYTARVGIARNASIVETLTMLPPSPCVEQHGQHRARAREHVPEVDAVEVVPLVVGLLVERLARAAVVTDVVDEHVDAAELVERGRDQRRRAHRVADVGDTTATAPSPTDRDLRLARARPASISANTTRAPSRDEALDDAATDPAAAAGDDRDLARRAALPRPRSTRPSRNCDAYAGSGRARSRAPRARRCTGWNVHLLAHALGHVVEVGLVVERDAPRR